MRLGVLMAALLASSMAYPVTFSSAPGLAHAFEAANKRPAQLSMRKLRKEGFDDCKVKANNNLRGALTKRPAQVAWRARSRLELQLATISSFCRNLHPVEFFVLGCLRVYALLLHHLQRLPNLLRKSQDAANLSHSLHLLELLVLGFLRIHGLLLHYLQSLPNLVRKSQDTSYEVLWEPPAYPKTRLHDAKGRLDRAKDTLREATATLRRDVTSTLRRDALSPSLSLATQTTYFKNKKPWDV
jgi:hypothetical protein